MADASPASLTVLGGPLKGRRYIFEDAVEEALVGSDPDCQLCLDLPGVSPIHARVWLELGGATVHDTHSPSGIFVNDDRVGDQAPLHDGDFLWLGTPGAEQSVLLQFRGPARQSVSPPSMSAVAAPAEEAWVLEEAPEEAATRTEERAEPEPEEWSFAEVTAPETGAARPEAVPQAHPTFEPAREASGALEADEFLFEESPSGSSPAGAAGAEPLPDEFAFDADAGSNQGFDPAQEAQFLVEEAAPAAVPEWGPETFEVVEAAPEAPSPAAPPPAPLAPPSPPPAPVPVARPAAPPVARTPAAPTTGVQARPKRPAAPAPRRQGGAGRVVVMVIAAVVVLGGGGGAAWHFLLRGPKIESVEPGQARPGDTVVIKGHNFAADIPGNEVRFKGNKPGRLLRASTTQLDVEVPEVDTPPGQDVAVPVVVRVGSQQSQPVQFVVTAAPRVHGISPSVAMPDEEVTLAGGGWGPGVKVRFGSLDAQVLEVKPGSIKVRVPQLTEAVGEQIAVVVSMGNIPSNTAPFMIGHLPLIASVDPPQVKPGDVLVLKGRGFHLRASANLVKLGAAPALILSASDTELRAVAPRSAEGPEVAIEVRVPASEHVGQAHVAVSATPDPLQFRFVAEPFNDGGGHDHALLASAFGPAFVLSASGGRSAAERALEAQNRLNEAADALRGGPAPDINVRLEGRAAIIVGSTGAPLLEITDEDASAYNEDWTGLGSKGGPVTAVRLALWWGGVSRDLALALARGERPKHAAGLAAEGRVLGDLYDAVKKAGRGALTRDALGKVKPNARDAVRIVAFRVPAAVLPPAMPVTTGAQAAVTPPPKADAFRVEGDWSGVEHEGGEVRYVTMTFTKGGGTLTYQRALSLTLPLLGLDQPQKGTVRYSLKSGNRTRYYVGKWDGQKISGRICADADCKTATGSFDLERER